MQRNKERNIYFVGPGLQAEKELDEALEMDLLELETELLREMSFLQEEGFGSIRACLSPKALT